MSLIRFQPRPKVPPIGFFQPISANPRDMMTDVEYLLGILKKLNEVIKQVNNNTEFINNYSGRIEEIEAEVNALAEEMEDFEKDINDTIDARFSDIRLELQAMIATTLTQANAYTDSIAARLEKQIKDISVGDIKVYDPTTGLLSNLQIVIDNLYEDGRSDALMADEYDALDLTATAYDAYELTAREYDTSAKSLLV